MNNTQENFNKSLDIVIFGSTGDLAHRKLFPSLYNLYKDSSFKDKFNIVALGRIDSNNNEFSARFNDTIPQEKEREEFYNKIKYFKCQHLKYYFTITPFGASIKIFFSINMML